MIENFSLSSDQKKALDIFSNWLNKEEVDKPFLLSGFAGSGKTFLSRKFLQVVEYKKICWTIAAPTHKAVDVLRKSIDDEGLRATWYPSTVHRLLRLRLKRRGDLEVCEKTAQTDKSLEQLGLVLIDEASMVDSNLLELIITSAHIYKTRLVFVGDPAQLPPVGEDKSPVFLLERAEKAHLNEVVRHQGPVLKLANIIREKQFHLEPPPCFSVKESSKGVIGALERQAWLDKAKYALKSSAERNKPDGARILCYTNRSIETLVPHARRAIYGNLADQMSVIPGEILISRRAVMTLASLKETEVEEEPGLLFGSNTEVVVNDVNSESFNLSEFSLEDQNSLAFQEIETLVAKISLRDMEYSIRLIPDKGSQSRFALDRLMQQLLSKAKSLPKTEARRIWKIFFTIRDSFASLGPASVLTVHRSQGSTFESVFVANDIFSANDFSIRRQLAYVAVTRARREVWLRGERALHSQRNSWIEKLRSFELN